MRHVYLVTHPHAQHHVDGIVGGWFDSELTARGEQQAELIGVALADTIGTIGTEEVEVYSSDLKRARHTADRIAHRFSVEVHSDVRLRERTWGVADGRPKVWLEDQRIPLPEFGDRLGHADGPEGAETRRSLVERVYPALDDILSRPVAHQIVVSHGSASSYLIAAWIGMPMESTDRVFFPLSSGGITTLVRDALFSHQVASLNDTRHLDALSARSRL